MTQEKVAMCDSGAGNGPVLPCTPPVEYSCAQNKRLPQGNDGDKIFQIFTLQCVNDYVGWVFLFKSIQHLV